MSNSSPDAHRREYRIRNHRSEVDPPRVVDVHASTEQIRALEEEGYLVRERLVQGETLEQLRRAADEVEAGELERRKPVEGGGFVRIVRHQPQQPLA